MGGWVNRPLSQMQRLCGGGCAAGIGAVIGRWMGWTGVTSSGALFSVDCAHILR